MKVWILFDWKENFHSVHKTKKSALILIKSGKDKEVQNGFVDWFLVNNFKNKKAVRV